ncbi:MAG: PD-(D/E)XK nuclease family protein [Roseiflexus sp.]|nr:PD-(D/E)XK nuclease family protein [Roseiflexus sp.]MCS7288235.1 PD-(D/E)XK nuclease family protein [Roseiflexus sp.]MDW8145908.1 PD-(D/E)XK nuclease family protein [Roseiflexaceae bacterium]
MTLSTRPEPYIIPSYSLVGDLLSYLNCGRQYRYHQRGALPPSKPVQLWFGQFIHGVMEEAYRRWNEQRTTRLNGGSAGPLLTFPWDDATLESLEQEIIGRLAAQGLVYSNKSMLELSRKRARIMINEIGRDLFPLIDAAEVRLQGIRPMPQLKGAPARSNYYEVTGVVDVLSTLHLAKADPGNRILQALMRNPTVQQTLARHQANNGSEFEIILDYKGMRRPPLPEDALGRFEWQIQTYTWLRAQQTNARPVLAGVLIFVNELEPSRTDMEALYDEVYELPGGPVTDVPPAGKDDIALRRWRKNKQSFPQLTFDYRLQRALHIVPITDSTMHASLSRFDAVVAEIEASVNKEKFGKGISASWKATPKRNNCTVCDFRHFCDKSDVQGLPLAP